MNTEDVTRAIESAYTGGIEMLVSAIPTQNGVQGQFFDRGIVFDYSITPDAIEYQENRSDSQYIAEYFVGHLAAKGIRCDSVNPYEYWKGHNLRTDSRKVQCTGGGTPCGGRCLPQGQKCRMTAGEAIKKVAKGVGRGIAEAGDFVFGNPWTDVRQAQSGQISGRRALARNLIKLGIGAASIAAANSAVNKISEQRY